MIYCRQNTTQHSISSFPIIILQYYVFQFDAYLQWIQFHIENTRFRLVQLTYLFLYCEESKQTYRTIGGGVKCERRWICFTSIFLSHTFALSRYIRWHLKTNADDTAINGHKCFQSKYDLLGNVHTIFVKGNEFDIIKSAEQRIMIAWCIASTSDNIWVATGSECINILIVFRLKLLLPVRLLFSFCSRVRCMHGIKSFYVWKIPCGSDDWKSSFSFTNAMRCFCNAEAGMCLRPSHSQTHGMNECVPRCLRYTWEKLKSQTFSRFPLSCFAIQCHDSDKKRDKKNLQPTQGVSSLLGNYESDDTV